MDNAFFDTPPISGNEQIPFSDLSPQQEENQQPVPVKQLPQSPVEAHNKKFKMYLMGLTVAVGLLFVIVIVVLAVVLSKPNSTIVANPTPIPQTQEVPAESSLPRPLSDKVGALEKNVKEVDLQELPLSYPQVDWDIKY